MNKDSDFEGMQCINWPEFPTSLLFPLSLTFSHFAGGQNGAGIRALAHQTGYAPDREQ